MTRFLCALLLAGCGGEEPSAKPPAPRGKTPAAVLEEFNAAVARADGAALLECVVPDQREHVPIMGARAARFWLALDADQDKDEEDAIRELDAIVQARGVSANYHWTPKPEEFLRIRDREAFVGELLRFAAKHRLVEQYARYTGSAIDGMVPAPLLPAQWKLDRWGVAGEGDRVEGRVESRIGEVDAIMTAYFRRVDGRWYLVIPPLIIRELGRGK